MADDPMHALSLHQPFASAIVAGPKRVENRTWVPPDRIVGKRIWIHAAKRWNKVLAFKGEALGFSIDREAAPAGAIVGSAVVTGWVRRHLGQVVDFNIYPVRSDSTLAKLAADSVVRDPWWLGPVGWTLADVRKLREPVPCVGRQRIWTPPEMADVLWWAANEPADPQGGR